MELEEIKLHIDKEMTPEERQHEIDVFCHKCMVDFPYFASHCLKIKTKSEGMKMLKFNRAQNFLNNVVDLMMATHGKVRIIIVKARQQGLSTWIGARGYWKAVHEHGTKVYILTHEVPATKNLFDMVKRYHDNCPPDLKPITQKSNAKELLFNEMESEYAVGTAKTGDTGRSQTMQFFHGSEVAFWKAADDIAGGCMQGVPEEPGTEMYLESTAYGAGGYFYSQWKNACYPADTPPATWNGYWRVFIPWYWEDKYRMELPEGFELTDDEREVVEAHGTDMEQMAWRRRKIAGMKNNLARFHQDYPADSTEAFNASLTNVLIEAHVVHTAMKNGREDKYEAFGRRILGVDVAREGDDDTCLVLRQGRVILWYERLSKMTTVQVAGLVRQRMSEHGVHHVCIDATGGYGAGVYDVLHAWGLGAKVTGVNFAERALDDRRYKNRRAEMYFLLKEWLEAGASVPDSDEFLEELCAITYKFDATNERLQLERKDEIKKRIGKSTDVSDAAALTFTMPSQSLSSVASDSFDPFTSFGAV